MIKQTLPIASLLLVAGCSTNITDAQMEAMHTPTLTLNCETGCSASYTDPRDRPSLPTNGWDTANTAINAATGALTSVAPWAALSITAVEGLSEAVGDDNSNNSVDRSDSSVDASDNSDRSDNRTYDSTADPTVVNPEVVTTPPPEIVNPETVRPEIVVPEIVQPAPEAGNE